MLLCVCGSVWRAQVHMSPVSGSSAAQRASKADGGGRDTWPGARDALDQVPPPTRLPARPARHPQGSLALEDPASAKDAGLAGSAAQILCACALK